MDRPIPDEHVAILRTLCHLGVADPLPEEIEHCYWQIKRLSDRINMRVSHDDLKWIACLKGYGEALPKEGEPTISELHRKGELKADDPLLVIWRKREIEAPFKRIAGDGQVVVEINGQERRVAADKVRVPELASCTTPTSDSRIN